MRGMGEMEREKGKGKGDEERGESTGKERGESTGKERQRKGGTSFKTGAHAVVGAGRPELYRTVW